MNKISHRVKQGFSTFRTITLVLISGLAVLVMAHQTSAGPITNPGAYPFSKASIYQGVLTIAPGAVGDGVLEIGNAGRDFAGTSDLYFRPGGLITGTANYLRLYASAGVTNLTIPGKVGIGSAAPLARVVIDSTGTNQPGNALNTLDLFGNSPNGTTLYAARPNPDTQIGYAGYFAGRVYVDTLLVGPGNCTGCGLPAGTSGQTVRYDSSNNPVANSNIFSSATGANLDYVGIGINNPASKLHVYGGPTWGTIFSLDAGSGLGSRRYDLVSTNNTAGEGGGKFLLKDNNTPGPNNIRLAIDSGGNVGIGTDNSDPSYKLQVSGALGVEQFNVASRSNLIISSTYYGTATTGWAPQTGGTSHTTVANPGFNFRGSAFQIGCAAGGDRDWTVGGAMSEQFVSGHTYRISMRYRATNSFEIHNRDNNISTVPANIGDAKYYSMTYNSIACSGGTCFVLIYCTSANTITFNEFTVQDLTAGTETWRMIADAYGNIGIGNTNPASKLHVKDGFSWGSDISVDAGGVANGRRYSLVSTGGDAGEGPGKFLIKDNNLNTARLILDSDGNVGIGTTGPTIKLAVGDTDTGLSWAGDGQLDIFSNNIKTLSARSGKVGIGTPSPNFMFDVVGADGNGTIAKFARGGLEKPLYISSVWNTDSYISSEGNIRLRTNVPASNPLGAGAVEAVMINTSGNVGINHTAPVGKLVVNNPFDITKDGESGDAVYAYTNTTNAAISGDNPNALGYAGYFAGRVYIDQLITNGCTGCGGGGGALDPSLALGNKSDRSIILGQGTGAPNPGTGTALLDASNAGAITKDAVSAKSNQEPKSGIYAENTAGGWSGYFSGLANFVDKVGVGPSGALVNAGNPVLDFKTMLRDAGGASIVANNWGTGNAGEGQTFCDTDFDGLADNPCVTNPFSGAGDAVAAFAKSFGAAVYAEQQYIGGYAGYFNGRVNILGVGTMLNVQQNPTGPGTVTIAVGTPTLVTGSGTQFLNTFRKGDAITIALPGFTESHAVEYITNSLSLVVTTPFTTNFGVGMTYTVSQASRFRVKGSGEINITAPYLSVGSATSPVANFDLTGSIRTRGRSAVGVVLSGDINAIAAPSTTVDGTNTHFTTELVVGDKIVVSGETRTVTAISTNIQLTVDSPFSVHAVELNPAPLYAIATFRDSSLNTQVAVDNTGKVGIGTTTAKGNLHVANLVSGLDTPQGPIVISRAWDSADTIIRASAIYHYWDSTVGAGPGDRLVFSVGAGAAASNPLLYSNARMYIGSNGNIGIGQWALGGAKLVVNNPVNQAGKVGQPGDAVYAFTNTTNAAISGDNPNALGYAGYFAGRVYIDQLITNGCTGCGGSGTVGPGTVNKLAKFTGTGITVGDSAIYDIPAVFGGSMMGINTNTQLSTLTVKPPQDNNIPGTTTANNVYVINGVGTSFTTNLGVGDRIALSSSPADYRTVTAINNDTQLIVGCANTNPVCVPIGNGTVQTITRKASALRIDTPVAVSGQFLVNDEGRLNMNQKDQGARLVVNALSSAGKFGTHGTGVAGSSGDAIYAYADGNAAISAEQNNASGWAGYFSGNVAVTANAVIGTSGGTRVAITGAGGQNAISEWIAGQPNPIWVVGRDVFGSGLPGIQFGPGVTPPDASIYRQFGGQLIINSSSILTTNWAGFRDRVVLGSNTYPSRDIRLDANAGATWMELSMRPDSVLGTTTLSVSDSGGSLYAWSNLTISAPQPGYTGSLDFRSLGALRMRITQGGNIGLDASGSGSMNPGSALTLKSGDIFISQPANGIIFKNGSTCARATLNGTFNGFTFTSVACPTF